MTYWTFFTFLNTLHPNSCSPLWPLSLSFFFFPEKRLHLVELTFFTPGLQTTLTIFFYHSLHVSIDHLLQKILIYFILILFSTDCFIYIHTYSGISYHYKTNETKQQKYFLNSTPTALVFFSPIYNLCSFWTFIKSIVSLLPSPVSSAIIWLELLLRGCLDL